MANTFIFDDEDQPDMGSPMPNDDDQGDDDQAPEEGEGNNRIFIMLLIGIGGFALVAILCIIGYFALSRPGGLLARADPAGTSSVVTTAEAIVQQTQAAAGATPTAAAGDISETATATQVVFVFATETPAEAGPTDDPSTATLAAQLTQLAKIQITATFAAKSTSAVAGAKTPTRTQQIPNTGFADEVGLPALVIATMILLGVILLARRLRANPAQ
jgi:hypothetical protein